MTFRLALDAEEAVLDATPELVLATPFDADGKAVAVALA